MWSEAQQRWVHLDPCEAAYDKPLLYEVRQEGCGGTACRLRHGAAARDKHASAMSTCMALSLYCLMAALPRAFRRRDGASDSIT